ncbi:MAG: CusA/CzcA family heavy metal efflux RND transporter [Bacteroidetes bacterium]|jgi:cobalt-zinc-cadmium resistance protein CzcA|nr:CusA/CzcA family heavy metal efflux RND transporter [Bacteroidota bacterium]
MFDALIKSVVKQRVLVVLLTIALAGWGIYSWRAVPLDAYPELTNKQVQILTEVPGLSPVEVEQSVTYPIEVNMTSLPGVVENRSLSQFGLSVVTLVFEEDTDIYFARQLVFERLSQVRDQLPATAEPAMAPVTTALGEIYQYALRDQPNDAHTYSARELRTMQDWILRPELRTVPGVVEANSLGGFVKQYHVLFRPEALVNHDITLDQAYEALRQSNRNAGGQYIERRDQQFVVRGIGRLGAGGGDIMDDIRNTVITSRGGTPVLVGDVADVEIGAAVRHGGATMNGEGETVTGIVLMQRGANAQEAVDNVEAKMEDLKQALPPGVQVDVFYNRNNLVFEAISTVTGSLMIGGLLVILVLLTFLGDWRSALIVSLVLPLTALITFILMNYFGFKANLMSLGGLAIGLGMFVDGAIVMVENIYRMREENPDESIGLIVVRAGREVARPIAFAVGVVIAVFLPLFTLEQMEGRMFRPLAFTVSFALMAALFLALTMAPALSSYLLKNVGKKTTGLFGSNGERDGDEDGNPVVRVSKRIYRPLLNGALDRKGLTIGVATVTLAIGIGVFTVTGSEFAPQLEEGAIAIQAAMKPSAALSTTQRVQSQVEKALLEFPEVTSAVSKTGRPEVATDPMGQELSDMMVSLTPRDTWRFDSKEALVNALRDRLDQIPGARFSFTQPIALRLDEMVSGVKSQVAVKIYGEDLDQLRRLGDEVADVLRSVPGHADVAPEQIAGFGYLEVDIRRADAARYGLSVDAVQRAIDMAVGGERVTEVLEGDRRFDLVGRFTGRARSSAEAVRNVPLSTPTGTQIRIQDVADVRLTQGPAQVSREQGKRKLTVESNVTGRDIGGFVEEAQAAVQAQVDLPPGYLIDWGGQFENQERANDRLMLILPITLAIVFVLLFMTFNSVKQAILIFLNIPVSIVGGIVLLWAMGLYMSVPASVGFIALLGIAVQNGIVMISFIDELRLQGRSFYDAVREGAMLRLRPILMTGMTTLLGLLPLLFAEGIGANVQRPLAAVVVGGLVTLLGSTLLLLPTLYALFNPSADHTSEIDQAVQASSTPPAGPVTTS